MTFPHGSRRLLVLPLLLLGLAFATGTSAQGLPVTTFPVSLTIHNPCTGEEVAVEGVGHAVGGEHFLYTLSGVSASGATYQIHWLDNEVGSRSQGAYASMTAGVIKFVREGGSGDDDYLIHATTHSTRNANGEWTVEFELFDSRCI